MEGTSTCASIWQVALVPVKRNCFNRVGVGHGLAGGLPNHLEAHPCRRGDRIQRGPLGLVHNWDVLHLKHKGFSVATDIKAAW